MNIFTASIDEIHQLYIQKKMSPLEVVKQHIEHIQKVNPAINAVCEENFTLALELAEHQTTELEKTQNIESLFQKKPLFGIPFSIKEMIAFKNFKMTAGSIHRTEYRAPQNATVVDRCLEAGAIPLVTTNVPEIGFWWETNNPVYGRTNNPYNVKRICGGSSGGEGSILGARGTVFGIGSDIGGSIRMPAAFCGISGHKPSGKVIPLTGHFRDEYFEIQQKSGNKYSYTVVGPMARRAVDLEKLFNVMSGPDKLDPETKIDLKIPSGPLDLNNLKVYTLASPQMYLTSQTEHEISEKVKMAGDLLSQLGASVEEFPERKFKNAARLWRACIKSVEDLPRFENVLNPEGSISLPKEFFNVLRGKSQYTLPSLITASLERLDRNETLEQDYEDAQKLKAELNAVLKNAILIMPAMPHPAPLHNQPLTQPFDFLYCAIFNALQLPSTVVPLSLSEKAELPLAIQIISADQNDALTIKAAALIEQSFGSLQAPNLL